MNSNVKLETVNTQDETFLECNGRKYTKYAAVLELNGAEAFAEAAHAVLLRLDSDEGFRASVLENEGGDRVLNTLLVGLLTYGKSLPILTALTKKLNQEVGIRFYGDEE